MHSFSSCGLVASQRVGSSLLPGIEGLPLVHSSKESGCNAEVVGSISESGRSPGGGNGH